MRRHVVIGTAGHIDHGKTELLKRITGMNPDRLKEEKERGMTTDLGFVFLGDSVTIIDVPGHERFVHNMLAGAATIDLVILVIAADDGIMPQTIEHFEITKLLGIEKGIIAITKVDLVEPEMVEIVIDEVKKFVKGTYLEGAPIVPLSPITGEGVERFLRELDKLINEVKERPDRGIFRLWIDRCFTMKGFGLVVAGTVLSGKARLGERLEILPLGREVRVRGLQVHNKPVNEVVTGERAAFNLQGAEKKEVERGFALVQPGYFKPTRLISARLKVLPSAPRPIRHRHTLIFHIGSAEAMARVIILEKNNLAPGEEGLVQFIFDRPIVCDWGDRFVVRLASPLTTVGGGMVIETATTLLKRKDSGVIERLRFLEEGSLERRVEAELLKYRERPVRISTLAHAIRVDEKLIGEEIKRMGEKVVEIDRHYFHTSHLQSLSSMITEVVEEFHRQNPTRKGIGIGELKSQFSDFDHALVNFTIRQLISSGKFKQSGDFIMAADFSLEIKEEDLALARRIEHEYSVNLFQPKKIDELVAKFGDRVLPIIRMLIDTDKLIDVGELIFHRDAIERSKEIVKEIFERNGEIRVSEFRKAVGTTRKYALPILQYLDRIGLTVKVGEVRKLKRRERR